MLGNAQRVVNPTSPDEERVGKTVEKYQRILRTGLFAVEQRHGATFGAAADRAREMKLRAGNRPAGMNEVCQGRKVALRIVDRAFERGGIGLTHGRGAVFAMRRSCGKLAAEVK